MILNAIFFVLVGAMVAAQFYLLFPVKNLVQQ